MPILNVQLGGEALAPDGRTIPVPPQIALTQRGPVVQVTVSVGRHCVLVYNGVSGHFSLSV